MHICMLDEVKGVILDISQRLYKAVIVYGIGKCYEAVKEKLFQCIKIDYLCDRKWENTALECYDGIPIIKRKQLMSLKDVLVIITAFSPSVIDSIKADLRMVIENRGGVLASADYVIEKISHPITGKMLREGYNDGYYRELDGYYQDIGGNICYFNQDISDFITIVFHGKNNKLVIGRDVFVESKLEIAMGSEGTCVIGDRTHIRDGQFGVSGGTLMIGKECLFSSQIYILNSDGHHIFDVNTHKRINYPRDIIIGDHVWIGFRVSILGGARIGNGCIVGAGAVTSGQFGTHQIIAGSPAKVIRENVCWSSDHTAFYDRDILEECIEKEALKYI